MSNVRGNFANERDVQHMVDQNNLMMHQVKQFVNLSNTVGAKLAEVPISVSNATT